ncbi:SEC-C metal-binding domain-containing protein [Peribacillus sp. SCS-155]|uniref:SEC-C metal-binding domain-containing protein n=1 Tax=Peribacillus sedimenti TaxID=3115297 RepID=UPI0039057C5F
MFNVEKLFEKINAYKSLQENLKGQEKFKKGLLYSKISSKESELLKFSPYLFVAATNLHKKDENLKELYNQKKEVFYNFILTELSNIMSETDRLSDIGTTKNLQNLISNQVASYYIGRFRSIMSREISFLPLNLRMFLYYELFLMEKDEVTRLHFLERLNVTLFKLYKVEIGQMVLVYYWLLRIEREGFEEEKKEEFTKDFSFLNKAKETRVAILKERGFDENRFLDEFSHSLISFTDLSNIHDFEAAKRLLPLWKEYYKDMPKIDIYFNNLQSFLLTQDRSKLADVPLEVFKEHKLKYFVDSSNNLLSEESTESYERQIKIIVQRSKDEEEKQFLLNLASGIPSKNQPCPCGSGEKFKKCCIGKVDFSFRLNSTPEEQSMFVELYQQAKRGDLSSRFSLFNLFNNGIIVEKNIKKAEEWLILSAEGGFTAAEHTIGICYKNDKSGFAVDYEKSIYWLSRAADKGDTSSQSLLGIMYREGQGVEKDYKKAFELFEKSGDADALANIAYMYQMGQGVEENQEKAIEFYEKAAEQKNIYALYNLGSIYFHGKGADANLDKAQKYFQIAADLGDDQSVSALRAIVWEKEKSNKKKVEKQNAKNNKAEIRPDPMLNILNKYLELTDTEGLTLETMNDTQIDYIKFMADTDNNGNCQIVLSLLYRFGINVEKDLNKAFAYMEKAAMQEIASAQYILGTMYFEGVGVKKNGDKAFKYFSLATDNGDTDGKISLADCLIRGIGTKRDPRRAFNILVKEAEKDNMNAQSLLGSLYATGTGCTTNYKEAVKWFNIAAEKGNSEAQFNLGLSYINERGVPENQRLALKWWRAAAKQGNTGAIQALSMFYS